MGSKINEISKTEEEKQLERELKKEASYKMLIWCLVIFGVLSLVTSIIFICAHPWHLTLYADSEQWGQYGDFIGGLFGTALAFLSVYYLIKTLRGQISANVAATNNNLAVANVNYLQQTDTKIRHLLSFYKEVRDSYDKKTPKHKTLNEEVALLKEMEIKSQDNYRNRLIASREVFDREFYIPCKPIAAVQFRVLYQIMCLIKTIDEKKNKDIKLFYGKMVRSQLSEDELLLLRYNCQCKYGEAMREHINRFNLLKHLPPLSLLEFQYWSKNVLNDNVIQNAIDTELIAERKAIREITYHLNQEPKKREKDFAISEKYSLHIEFSSNHKEFVYCLTRKNNLSDLEHIDEAFTQLGDDHTINFVKDFLHEVFEYSNFQKYNEGLDYQPLNSKPEYNQDKEETIFRVFVRSLHDKDIVLNYGNYLEKDPEANNNEIGLVQDLGFHELQN